MDNRALVAGVGLGAAFAYMLDPNAGGRRRALVRDKIVHGTKRTGRAMNATLRDLSNRSRGIVAATRRRRSGEGTDDSMLLERVRARLGHVCSHPHAIDVEVHDGVVTLRGPILVNEAADVERMARKVRGVHSVVDELEPHVWANNIPALQGEGRRSGSTLDLFQRNWAPATRALVTMGALAAGAAMVYARR
jgi:osmotically-inducible protein OsmY